MLVGIDKYKHSGSSLRELSGCQSDVADMKDFLMTTLGVSQDRITVLLNEEATRSNIKREIRALAKNSRIQKGDPILIYFAGHGTQTPPPKSWGAGGNIDKIQMVVPHNFDPQGSRNEETQGIPDIVLGALLAEVARVKGDNIVGLLVI